MFHYLNQRIRDYFLSPRMPARIAQAQDPSRNPRRPTQQDATFLHKNTARTKQERKNPHTTSQFLQPRRFQMLSMHQLLELRAENQQKLQLSGLRFQETGSIRDQWWRGTRESRKFILPVSCELQVLEFGGGILIGLRLQVIGSGEWKSVELEIEYRRSQSTVLVHRISSVLAERNVWKGEVCHVSNGPTAFCVYVSKSITSYLGRFLQKKHRILYLLLLDLRETHLCGSCCSCWNQIGWSHSWVKPQPCKATALCPPAATSESHCCRSKLLAVAQPGH